VIEQKLGDRGQKTEDRGERAEPRAFTDNPMPPTIVQGRQVRPYDKPSQRFWGVLTRKERWGLSWRGRLLVTSAALIAGYLMLLKIYPFLAVTDRVNTKVLVVEGWIHPYAIRIAADEFKSGSYQRIFTTGGPVTGNGGYINDYNTTASVGADALKKVGISPDLVQMVPSHVFGRDRTYSSAVALRDWLREHDIRTSSINVLTQDVHARRSRLLFGEALGPNISVGVIAVPNPDYDGKRWWGYSEGVEQVIGESIAYIYAKLFFYPSASPPEKEVSQAAPASG
jgi:hypothetical protein